MEITIDRQYLQSKVDLVKGITKHKSLLPVCRSVLIALDKGKTGKLMATDLEVSAITALANYNPDWTGDDGLKVVVPAGTLSEILGNFGDQEVILNCEDPGHILKIESGRVEIGLTLTDPEEFPNVEALNEAEAFQVPAKNILRGISKVLYAIGTDDTRYILTGVLIQAKDGEFRMCATDGFRLALLKQEIPDLRDTPQIVIPGRNLKLLKDMLDENATVGVIITDARVQFMTTQATVILRTLQETYPNYESILASTGALNIAFAKRISFLECLSRMAALATKTDPVRISRTSDSGMTVRIESEKGYAQETIDCDFKNDTNFDFSFNLKFFLDAVEHIDADQLVIRYPAAYGMVVLDSTDYICAIMPIRTQPTPIEMQAPDSAPDTDGGQNE